MFSVTTMESKESSFGSILLTVTFIEIIVNECMK